jgi:putative ABC transport system substrate-binding protein
MRAIMKGLKAELDGRAAQGTPYPFQIDYVEGEIRGKGRDDEVSNLAEDIRSYLAGNTPSLVVPIATTATRAAQAVFGASAGSKPIVFTVISDPVAQGIVLDKSTPGGNTTGVSTQLSQMAPECLKKFKGLVGSLDTICWVYRGKFDPSEAAAAPLLVAANDANVATKRLSPIPKDRAEVDKRLTGGGPDDLPKVEPRSFPPKVGLLVVPDDLVVSHGDTVIQHAQHQQGVPVFFQVVEFVRPGDQRVSALGGYGVPGETTGREAADYVDRILRGTQPGTLPIKELGGGHHKFWWSNTVARHFKVQELAAKQADTIFP